MNVASICRTPGNSVGVRVTMMEGRLAMWDPLRKSRDCLEDHQYNQCFHRLLFISYLTPGEASISQLQEP